MSRARRSAIALRHVAFEDLGLVASILDDAGWAVSYCEAPIENLSDRSIERADLLIVLGGPVGVYEADRFPFLNEEIALIERRLTRTLPTLGICLGSQLMAKALGSRVFRGSVKEIGWGHVELTDAGLHSCLAPLAEKPAVVLHWHGDTFDLPEGAVRLASNQAYENQAFAYGPCGLALQFHAEANPQRLEEWFVGHAVELTAAGVSVPDLRAETTVVADRLRDQAGRIFRAWLEQIS